mmetsp:Transcript_28859/g.40639  ORF Transcript_28859/g.40639 Transcript_28859/m.40639 type:complete len:317 (+) Transcript_28859:72-1022(+)
MNTNQSDEVEEGGVVENTNSPPVDNKKKRKAKDPAPSDETRRNNHKLIEQRRRKKINDKIEELRHILSSIDSQNPNRNQNPAPGSLQGNEHPNKSSILDNTIVAIRHLQQVAIKLAIQHRQLQYESVHLRKVLARASKTPQQRTNSQFPHKTFIDGFAPPAMPSIPPHEFASTSVPRRPSPPMMPPPSPLPPQITQDAQMRIALQQQRQYQESQMASPSFPPYSYNSNIPTPMSSAPSSNAPSSNSSSSSSAESTPRSSVSSLADVAMQQKLWDMLRRQQQEMQRQAMEANSDGNSNNNNNASSSTPSSQQNSPPF